MLLTHIAYRKQTPEAKLSDFKMPGFPYLDYLTLLFFIMMIILLLILPNNRVAMVAAILIFILLSALTKIWQKEKAC